MVRDINSVFRFRSLKNFDDSETYNEIDDLSIFLASTDSLNDPYESQVGFEWNGDEIIWRNFLKYYVYSFIIMWWKRLRHEAGHEDFDFTFTIPHEFIFSERAELLFEKTQRDLNANNGVIFLLECLCNETSNLNTEDVLAYLKCFHVLLVFVVLDNASQLHIVENSNSSQSWSEEVEKYNLSAKIMAYMIDKELDSSKDFDHIFLSNDKNEVDVFLKDRFPRNFLNNLDRLIFSDWYLACFSGNYSNSAMWGHYASGHRGICLEFRLDKIDNQPFKGLSVIGNGEEIVLPMFLVDYVNGLKKLDFFGLLPLNHKDGSYDFWLKNNSGEYSIRKPSYDENHTDKSDFTFYQRALRKSLDWSYESEFRILVRDINYRLKDNNRTFNYPITSLLSLTFGVKTPIHIRKNIMDTLRSKPDFQEGELKFYQAYFSYSKQCMERREINL